MKRTFLLATTLSGAALAGCGGGSSSGGGYSTGASTAAPTTSSSKTGTSPVSSSTRSAPKPTPTPTPAPAASGFTAAASLQAPRGLHTATLLLDGRVLVVGGVDAQGAQGGSFVVENEIYDPTAAAFTKVSDPSLGGQNGYMVGQDGKGNPVAIPRYSHTATLLPDGTVLIVGGIGVEQYDQTNQPIQGELASAFIFDPKTNSFAPAKGTLNVPRYNHYAAVFQDAQGAAKVLIAGGFNSQVNNGQGGTLPTAEIYDPATQTFSMLSQGGNDMAAPRMDGGAVSLGKQVLFVGGDAYEPAQQASGTAPAAGQQQLQQFLSPGAEAFDASQNKFAAIQAVPAQDRFWSTLDLAMNQQGQGGIFLAGGLGAKGPVLEIEAFDGSKWSTVGNLQEARVHHASAAAGQDVLWVGGVTVDAQGNMTTLSDAEYFVAALGNTEILKMAQGRNSATATTLADGSILVAGGFSGGTKDPLGLDGTSVAASELLAPVGAAGSTPRRTGTGSTGTGSTGTGSTGTGSTAPASTNPSSSTLVGSLSVASIAPGSGKAGDTIAVKVSGLTSGNIAMGLIDPTTNKSIPITQATVNQANSTQASIEIDFVVPAAAAGNYAFVIEDFGPNASASSPGQPVGAAQAAFTVN